MTVTVEALGRHRDLVQSALREAVGRLDADIREVACYHFGWCDEHGRPVTASGGKALRSGLALLGAEAVGGTPATALPGAVAVELVHNFSLVHDDLMDRDVSRRHRRTVWAVWDDATAVLVGDAMLCLAHEVLAESESAYVAEAGRVLARATRALIRGQAQDLAFERRHDVTLGECTDMAAGKTGALLAASASVGAVLAGGSTASREALEAYGDHLGLAFQLVDDVLGIWGSPESTGKPVHSDLRSRKKTLPVTWTIENGGDAGVELARWLREEEGDPQEADLVRLADLVDRAGGRAWALEEARRRAGLAVESLSGPGLSAQPVLPALPASVRDQLGELTRFVVERQV